MIKYTKHPLFSHRFISHTEQHQVQQIVSRIPSTLQIKKQDSKSRNNKKNTDKSQIKSINQFYVQSQTNQPQEGKQWLKKYRPNEIKNIKQHKTHQDILLQQFSNDDTQNKNAIKQQYIRVYFQKIALENSYQNLLTQSLKKDQVINQLKSQLQRTENPPNSFPQNNHFAFTIPSSTTNQSKVPISFNSQLGRGWNQ